MMNKKDIKSQLDLLIKDLNCAKGLTDENAGNLIVDPALVAGIVYWWGKLNENNDRNKFME